MVPKLIFANVLAVIMMTFEQHAPAEMQQTPQKEPQKLVDGQARQPEPVVQVAASKQDNQEVVVEHAVAKKRMHNTQHKARTPHTRFISSKSAPIDCCFRGYKS
ncbi:MAG: hypothetical protein ACT6QZ_06620 [Methylophilus sp.]